MKRPPGVLKDQQRGTWYFQADAPGVEGKRRLHRQRGFASMDDAKLAREKFVARVRADRVPVPDDDSVAAFAQARLAALPAEGLEPATVKNYGECVARLTATIGAVTLQELTALDLDRAYAALLEQGRSARTVRASHVATKKMLTEALRLRIVAENVAVDARPPKAKAAPAKQFPTWTYEQTESFLAAVADNEHAALWTFAAFTGLRRGELVALLWEDVDLAKSTVTVCRSVGKGVDGVHDKAPKTDSGRRTVELDDPLVGVLRAHRKAQQERRLALGAGWRSRDLVFCELDGSAIGATSPCNSPASSGATTSFGSCATSSRARDCSR